MNQALTVGLVQGRCDLDGGTEDLIQSQGSLLEPRGERLAFQVLHDKELDAFLLADVMKGADVRMIETRDGFRLAIESQPRLLAQGEARGEDLDGDRPVQPGVAGLVYLPHPSRADQREDLVGA